MKTEYFEGHPIDLSTEEVVTYPNGGMVVVYNAIDRKTEDYKRILSCATFFAQHGKQVVMLPKLDVPYKNPIYDRIFGTLRGTPYYGKCPDMTVDGVWYEHEGFTGQHPKSSFRNMCNHGFKQSDRIIIEDCGLTDRQMRKSLAERIKKGTLIEELWIRNISGLRLFYKNT